MTNFGRETPTLPNTIQVSLACDSWASNILL